jgi:hypothetical protein
MTEDELQTMYEDALCAIINTRRNFHHAAIACPTDEEYILAVADDLRELMQVEVTE